MIAPHIHDALGQVKRLQSLILSKRRFRGYSGIARIAGAVVALSGACVLSLPGIPRSAAVHLGVWLTVLLVGTTVNYGALAVWFWFDPTVERKATHLLPAADALPALLTGGIISYGLLRTGTLDLLFGTWMCCYGVAHIAHRATLPHSNYLLGWFYLACGAVVLAQPNASFFNPWPMGLTFFLGELWGGIVFLQLDKT